MKTTTYLLITIFIMHITTLINIVVFDGVWNGIVIAINTILLILALGLVMSLKDTKKMNN